MRRIYNELEDMVRRYIAKPLVVIGLSGILAYNGSRLYGGDDVAIDNHGNFIVASAGSAQRYDGEGNKIGEPIRDIGIYPSIAMNDAGFVIAWEGSTQRYDKNGNRIGDAIGGIGSKPHITMNDDEFIIASVSSPYNIFIKRFDREGNKIGEFQANSNTYGEFCNIDIEREGNFIVVWSELHGDSDIYARLFNKDGIARGEEFLIKRNVEDEWVPAVAMDYNGNFVSAWVNETDYEIDAQRFDQDGNRIGDEFRVTGKFTNNLPTSKNMPDIGINKSLGNFVIVWPEGNTLTASFGQRYDSNGNSVGDKFNIYNGVSRPRIAMNDNGDFVIIGPNDFVQKFHFDGDLFTRGDANRDKEYNIADPITTLFHLFSDLELKCLDAADSNDDGRLDVSDAVYSLEYLFLGGHSPPEPYPTPGRDETEDSLGCGGYEPTL